MYGISYNRPGAKDRRSVVRMLYGDWFANHGLKLTRDYLVDFLPYGPKGFWPPDQRSMVRLTILNARKAVLFKLTWGGQ